MTIRNGIAGLVIGVIAGFLISLLLGYVSLNAIHEDLGYGGLLAKPTIQITDVLNIPTFPITILILVLDFGIIGFTIGYLLKNKINKKFLLIVKILVIVLLFLNVIYFTQQFDWPYLYPVFGRVSSGLEAYKNAGCRTYLNQNPPCTNAAAVSFTYDGKSINFYDFMADNYGCTGANADICIRQRCTCPGY